MLLAAGAVWFLRRQPGTPDPRIPGEGKSPVVEVLNTTRIDGLAREVTRRLRSAGIDVVYYGSDWTREADSTTILVRSADSTAALEVRRALGFGRVVFEPDPKLLLDATVLLGADAPRSLHLHP